MKNLFSTLLFLLGLCLTEAIKVGNTEVPATLTMFGTDATLLLLGKEEAEQAKIKNSIQHYLQLKPNKMPYSKYNFLSFEHSISVFGPKRRIPLNNVENCTVQQGVGIKVLWGANTRFQTVNDYSHYLVNLCDGSKTPLKGILVKEGSSDKLRLTITKTLGEPSAPEIYSKLKALQENAVFYVGGPYFQDCDPECLEWSPFTFTLPDPQDVASDTITINGTIKQMYWLKDTKSKEHLYKGTLKTGHDGAQMFVIKTTIGTCKDVFKHIKKCMNYGLNLCLTTLNTNAALPDRKIFAFERVDSPRFSTDVEIKLDWLESQEGSSFTHAAKLEHDGQPVSLPTAVYFNKGSSEGTLVVHAPLHKMNEAAAGIYMTCVHNALVESMTKDNYKLEVSLPLGHIQVDPSATYTTALKFTVTNPSIRGAYMEIEFSAYE